MDWSVSWKDMCISTAPIYNTLDYTQETGLTHRYDRVERKANMYW